MVPKILFLGQQRRRQWHPTPVLLPGKSHEWRSLIGYSPWGLKESNTTWVTSLSVYICQYMLSRFSRVWLSMTLWTMAARLLCPWDSASKNTGVGCHFLLQIYISATLLVYSTSSFPAGSTSLFSVSVSLFLPCKQVRQYHFSRFRIYALICNVCFSLSDLLHSVQ